MKFQSYLSISSDAEVVVDDMNGNVSNTVLSVHATPWSILIRPYVDLERGNGRMEYGRMENGEWVPATCLAPLWDLRPRAVRSYPVVRHCSPARGIEE